MTGLSTEQLVDDRERVLECRTSCSQAVISPVKGSVYQNMLSVYQNMLKEVSIRIYININVYQNNLKVESFRIC